MELYPLRHPSARHSRVNWSTAHINWRDGDRPFSKARVHEVVLQAGDIMYLPTYWFHFIVSLNINYQCNSRSGDSQENQHFISKCGFGPRKEYDRKQIRGATGWWWRWRRGWVYGPFFATNKRSFDRCWDPGFLFRGFSLRLRVTLTMWRGDGVRHLEHQMHTAKLISSTRVGIQQMTAYRRRATWRPTLRAFPFLSREETWPKHNRMCYDYHPGTNDSQ